MRKFYNSLYKLKVYFGILITLSFFFMIILHVFFEGIGTLNFDFVFGLGKPEGKSLLPAIINTLLIIVLTLSISVPVGVFCAIYLNEYSRAGSKFVKIIRLTTESLAGIPSIIYGLFGFLFFGLTLKWTWSIISGVLTLSIMVLPTIVRSTEEALIAIPNSYREGSYALGVGKLRTIIKLIIPSSISGILVSIILSIGRIVGETAALFLTAGTVMTIPRNLFDSGATLSVFMYTLTSEGLHFDSAYSVAIVLLVIVFIINLFANFISNKFSKNN